MPDKNLVEIKVSRLIPAPKWKIIRLLTKVSEFPSYIPTVKEASVIERHHNTMKTKWHIQLDNIPIRWVSEDTLNLAENKISFKAVEGDLEEFRGEWDFKGQPEGTRVSVTMYLSVGIPAIQEFAEAYIKKVVTRNFEAILEAFERRLISNRYASYRHGDADKIAGFGVIGHFYNFNHLTHCLKMLNPDFKMPSREFIGRLFNITPSFKLYDLPEFKATSGAVTKGCFIVATFIPDMMEEDIWLVLGKVVRACKIAEKYGVGVVTLGGFTSIVGERIGQQISNEVDVPVTTGNAFTAAMVIDGVLKAVGLLNKDISNAKLTIVGGTGDIGSACARSLADNVKQLTITGRTKSNLRRMQAELAKRRKAKIIATTDNERAVKDADIVIAVASVSASILKIEWFKPGAIICDVGYPKNISYTPTTRQDILIFSGGLTKSPQAINFPVDTGLPSSDVLYGCFAEAIILALEKRFENFSFGRGNITVEKIDEIRNLGRKHGFEVAPFYWGNKLVDTSVIDRIREAVKA